jgi:aspartokinase
MKLAEALIERAEIKKMNMQLVNRIKNNVKTQEGDPPAEMPEELIAEYERNMQRFLELVQQINRTNNETQFNEELKITDAIAMRDCLGAKIRTYREIYEAATIRTDMFSRNEIKFIRVVDSKELQATINTLSKEYRELDTKLQGLNWTVDLV